MVALVAEGSFMLKSASAAAVCVSEVGRHARRTYFEVIRFRFQCYLDHTEEILSGLLSKNGFLLMEFLSKNFSPNILRRKAG